MSDLTLRDCRILVVEDEYMLADELSSELSEAGAIVLGPAGTLEDAMRLIRSEEPIHGAILDVNLRGEMAFAAADMLLARKVPLVFTTGYDLSALLPRFADVVRCEKPTTINKLAAAIGRVIHA